MTKKKKLGDSLDWINSETTFANDGNEKNVSKEKEIKQTNIQESINVGLQKNMYENKQESLQAFSTYIKPSIKKKLHMLSIMEERKIYEILEDALKMYFELQDSKQS